MHTKGPLQDTVRGAVSTLLPGSTLLLFAPHRSRCSMPLPRRSVHALNRHISGPHGDTFVRRDEPDRGYRV